MKNYTVIGALLALFLFASTLPAQVVLKQDEPYSFQSKSKITVPIEVMPKVNARKLLKEDEKDTKGKQAPRFGVLHEVNYTLKNAGEWETLPNGDRLWKLRIKAPDARTININYSMYDLPKGGKLFIYSSPEPKTVLGPFTSFNEKSNDRFATGFTYGEECTIEYYEPAAVANQGRIEIDGIVHGYRTIPRQTIDGFLKDFRGSGTCNYDVECAISAGWEDQIKSVGMHILANGTRWCSGALINNTANDCKPYFLTADHCFNVNAGATLNDIFMFNYHSPSPACPGRPTVDGPTNQTVQGATVVANAAGSDFFLVELSSNPIDFYDVYYSGWSRETTGKTSSVAIHHPDSDVKKFSVDNDPPNGGDNRYWEVVWEDGTTEPGSSGSPLFDQNKRIIGQLCCGGASCSNPNSSDDYGRVNYSWSSNGTNANRQLAPWLDPINSGVMFIDGSNCSSSINCYSMLDNGNGLSTNETGAVDYESSDWIETTGPITIQSGARVDYDAVNYVLLNPGFMVMTNGVFNAFIDGCNNGSGGVNVKDEISQE